jgi:NAD-dependent deacetylase
MITDLDTARQWLSPDRQIVCFSGAGLSAESGISTFRDTETHALWSRYDPMQMASQAGFADAPERVMDWYAWRRERLAAAAPNPGHRALAGRPDIVHVTQNVDDLLERAGVPAAAIHHVHGSLLRDHCNALCGHRETVDLSAAAGHRRCPSCGDVMRPSVVWFGESLPEAVWTAAETACAACDTLLVVGTSAVVYPAAGLIRLARRRGARIIIVNTQASEASALADIELTGPSGEWLPRLLAPLPGQA